MITMTQESMDYVSHVALMPLVLTINFSLFQYLLMTFYSRRHELRVKLLLSCAFIGFMIIVPFSHPDDTIVEYLDDISETASTLTFMMQIVILGRDINKKVRIPALAPVTRIAEICVVAELVIMVGCMVRLCDRRLTSEWINIAYRIVEDVSLAFIFFARFFYIIMARGFKTTMVTKRLEIVLYVLFATNQYPFVYLEAKTQVSWQSVQALWCRLTLAMCILQTIKEKIRSTSSKQMKTGISKATATRQSFQRSTVVDRTPAHKVVARPVTSSTTTTKGPGIPSLHKIGISFRTVVPVGGTHKS